jgi:hypothetical protein
LSCSTTSTSGSKHCPGPPCRCCHWYDTALGARLAGSGECCAIVPDVDETLDEFCAVKSPIRRHTLHILATYPTHFRHLSGAAYSQITTHQTDR